MWASGSPPTSRYSGSQLATSLRDETPTLIPATDWPLFYPLPAILVLAPFAWLPLPAFHLLLLCAGLGGLALGLAASRREALFPALLSAAFFSSVVQGQWAPVLVAGAVVPWLAVLWSCKPSLGLALFAGHPHRHAVTGGLALVAVSFAVLPHWPLDWLHNNLRQTNHLPPILRPGGFLLLLAFLRWRRPEARLLGALAIVPHTVAVGDALLLFLCCRTKWEGYGLAMLSYAGAFWYAARIDPSMTLVESVARGWPALLVCQWLPALAMVLYQPREAAANPPREAVRTHALVSRPQSRPDDPAHSPPASSAARPAPPSRLRGGCISLVPLCNLLIPPSTTH